MTKRKHAGNLCDPGVRYLAAVLLLAGFVGRAIAPKAIGQPYVKER